MQNKYLIKISKKFWFWFWTQLMNGFAPSDIQGNYKRPTGITIDSKYDINNENGEIFLLVGNSCPWCQRTLLVHKLKRLSKEVKVVFLKQMLSMANGFSIKNSKYVLGFLNFTKKLTKK